MAAKRKVWDPKFSVYAHKNGRDVICEKSECNGGNVELTRKYLESQGYTTIVIVRIKK